MTVPFKRYLARTKVAPRVEPALVGLGVVLAGVPGMPQLTRVIGEVAIEQGRIHDEGHGITSLHLQTDQIVPDISVLTANDLPEGHDDDVDETEKQLNNRADGFLSTLPLIAGNDIAEVNRSDAGTIKPVGEAQATSTHPLPEKLRLSLNPLDQLGFRPNSRPTTPSRSSPSISTPRAIPYANMRSDEELIQNYDLQSQSHLLRSHYCRSEVCYDSTPLYFTLSIFTGTVSAFAREHM
jgi:phosphatidylinositol 4-kinase